jgi:glycosyltransferase involved in cell wall biosynthesis
VPAASYVAIGSPPTAAPEFSVILLSRNELAPLCRAVESLRRARGEHSVEFVFVVGGSTDGTLNYVRELARRERVQLIVTHPDEPFRPARNRNRGAEAASGTFLLFADSDVEVTDARLFDKLARVLSDSRAGVAGMAAGAACGDELLQGAGRLSERVWSATPATGPVWGIRAAIFAELGGMEARAVREKEAAMELEYRALRRNYRLARFDSGVNCTGWRAAEDGSRQRTAVRDRAMWEARFRAHRPPQVSIAIA